MPGNSKLARLRDLLWHMEVEVGLERLSQPNRDVYYAACLVADADEVLHSEQVRHHHMVDRAIAFGKPWAKYENIS